MTSPQRPRDLNAVWLPLLARLTERFPDWGLWKNADSALMGQGDFDSTAPESDWEGITEEFSEWAAGHSLDPVAACRHVQGVLFLVAVDQETGTLYELDVNARKYFRGWTVFRPQDLRPMMEVDKRGFRRVRPGAEGVTLLTQNGLKWGGRRNEEGLRRKRVAEFLASDPEGVAAAARLFGAAEKAILRAAGAVANGRWDRAAMLQVEARALIGAVGEPGIVVSRFRAKEAKKRCQLLRTIFVDGRTIDGNISSWVERVALEGEILASTKR
ncbi:MAG: hypothetical protein M3124_05255 [Actinomycetota bacterium]|nr:hypothetical protein [Actinomycetota bacterium]